MGKRAVVVGWDKSLGNIGDQIIIDCCSHIIEMVAPDFEVSVLDWNNPEKNLVKKGARFALSKVLGNCMVRVAWDGPRTATLGAKHAMARAWTWLGTTHYDAVLNDADVVVVVVVVGGALKYKTQFHSYYTERLIKCCSKRNLPLMLNAIGIEGYSDADIRCQSLVKRLNSGPVGCITTRDDLRLLNNRFVYDPGITTALVGDSALWIPETYTVSAEGGEGVIGVNLVTGSNFKAYGSLDFSYAEAIDLYAGIVRELKERGRECVLFTNGMSADYRFGKEVLARLGLPESILVPPHQNPDDYVRMVSSMSGVISGRMHAAITAYALDIPVAGFCWGEKLELFADVTGMQDRFLVGQEVTPANIVNAFEQAEAYPADPEARERLKSSTPIYIASFLDGMARS